MGFDPISGAMASMGVIGANKAAEPIYSRGSEELANDLYGSPGEEAKEFMDEAYPGTNPSERLGGGGGGSSAVGGAQQSARAAKQTASTNATAGVITAALQRDTAETVANIQKGTTERGQDLEHGNSYSRKTEAAINNINMDALNKYENALRTNNEAEIKKYEAVVMEAQAQFAREIAANKAAPSTLVQTVTQGTIRTGVPTVQKLETLLSWKNTIEAIKSKFKSKEDESHAAPTEAFRGPQGDKYRDPWDAGYR